MGKLNEAEHEIRDCMAICQAEPNLKDNWRKFDAMSVLGGILAAEKDYDRAEPLLLIGNEGMLKRAETVPASNRPRLKQTVERLVKLYEAWGKKDQLAAWQTRLAEFDQPPSGK